MAKSLPSIKFAIVDAPEVSGFEVGFVYNFFTPDESVNESGLVTQKFIAEKTAINFKQSFIDSSLQQVCTKIQQDNLATLSSKQQYKSSERFNCN